MPRKVLLSSLLVMSAHVASADELPIEYNRDIRPILSESCFRCHGPDARQRKAGLRLDVEAEAKGPLKSGSTAIVAGSSSRSELIARVKSSDADERMPPPESGKTLSPQQVDLLARWIDAGAPYEPHWSLKPILRPTPPHVEAAAEPRASASGWVTNPIDAFVRAKLREQGLRPSPEVDRATLCPALAGRV
jgi:mono/diheme cytochrome c family protein